MKATNANFMTIVIWSLWWCETNSATSVRLGDSGWSVGFVQIPEFLPSGKKLRKKSVKIKKDQKYNNWLIW